MYCAYCGHVLQHAIKDDIADNNRFTYLRKNIRIDVLLTEGNFYFDIFQCNDCEHYFAVFTQKDGEKTIIEIEQE
jgi:hypothetical protein